MKHVDRGEEFTANLSLTKVLLSPICMCGNGSTNNYGHLPRDTDTGQSSDLVLPEPRTLSYPLDPSACLAQGTRWESSAL